MDVRTKLIRNLRSSTSDQESLNREILRLRRNFREVEKRLNRDKDKKEKKGDPE